MAEITLCRRRAMNSKGTCDRKKCSGGTDGEEKKFIAFLFALYRETLEKRESVAVYERMRGGSAGKRWNNLTENIQTRNGLEVVNLRRLLLGMKARGGIKGKEERSGS